MNEKTLYKRFVKETPNILHHKIENFLNVGTPDDLIYVKNKFYTVELKYTEYNKIKISPFQIVFGTQRPIGHFLLVGHKKEVKLFEFCGSDILISEGFTAKNYLANSWQGIRDYFNNLK